MRHFPLLSMVALSLACGARVTAESAGSADSSDADCDPWQHVCTVTLRPSSSQFVRLELETTAVEGIAPDLDAYSGEGVLSAVLVGDPVSLQLRPPSGGGHFCAHSGSFSRVSDVPTDPCLSDCRGLYHPCRVGAYNPGEGTGGTAGAGFLINVGDGDSYRALVRSLDEIEVTLEYTGIQ